MRRLSTQETLERAHKVAAQSMGKIALATVTSRVQGRTLREAVDNLREAANLLETLLPAHLRSGGEL